MIVRSNTLTYRSTLEELRQRHSGIDFEEQFLSAGFVWGECNLQDELANDKEQDEHFRTLDDAPVLEAV